MIRSSALIALLSLACIGAPNPSMAANPTSVFVDVVPGRLVDVSVLSTHGHGAYPVIHSGRRYYLAGEVGQPYTIRLTNRSPARVLAVVSVDGVNVITGQDAAIEQAGYVIAPYGSTEIQGWRKSMRGVAAFEFSPQAMSYASRTGRPGNVGVIGVAVFEEDRPVVIYPAPAPSIASDRSRTIQSESSAEAARMPALGTGHGAPIYSEAQVAEFRRATRLPTQVTRLEYDSRSNLQYRGLWPVHRELNPFPGFVPDP